MTTPATSQADIPTAHASRYLQQLCKHFGHKIPVEFTPTEGRITFPMGDCLLTADDAHLHLECRVPEADQLDRLQEVVASHLVRFAFREELAIEWAAAVA